MENKGELVTLNDINIKHFFYFFLLYMVNNFFSIKKGYFSFNFIFARFTRSFKKQAFTNDTLFEINQYRQQKQKEKEPPGILLNKHARQGSTQSAIVFGTQKRPTLRQYSCSCDINTADSEDLTAKEFADMTGIRIKEEEKCFNPIYLTPKIWDLEFWKDPNENPCIKRGRFEITIQSSLKPSY